MKLLGIRIDNLTRAEILSRIEGLLEEDKFHQIATVNPEFILQAQKDSDFKSILNSCDLNVADGIGIFYAFLRFGETLKARFAGIDLTQEILRIANERRFSVFLAINKNGLSSLMEIRKILEMKYPAIVFDGNEFDREDYRMHESKERKYDVLLCNFGSPWQEKFIQSLKNDNIRLAIGLGGSFDYITGKVERAPHWMRRSGLEWLWRFIKEPAYRAVRIFRAVIIFPIKILFSKKSK